MGWGAKWCRENYQTRLKVGLFALQLLCSALPLCLLSFVQGIARTALCLAGLMHIFLVGVVSRKFAPTAFSALSHLSACVSAKMPRDRNVTFLASSLVFSSSFSTCTRLVMICLRPKGAIPCTSTSLADCGGSLMSPLSSSPLSLSQRRLNVADCSARLCTAPHFAVFVTSRRVWPDVFTNDGTCQFESTDLQSQLQERKGFPKQFL